MTDVTVVYVAGCTHSGSTLLNRILNAHPEIVSVGGVKNIPRALAGQKNCSCGQHAIDGCPFWGRVDQSLDGERTLFLLRTDAADDETFERDNCVLFAAIFDAAAVRVVVDTSRDVRRMRRLRNIDGLAVLPVLLFRDPRGQFASLRRKNMSRWHSLTFYWKRNLSVLAGSFLFPERVVLSYEEFCRDPSALLAMILPRLGVADDAKVRRRMLQNWGEQEVHMLGGNRMRRIQDSTIHLDEGWRYRLGLLDKTLAFVAGYPVWLLCWLFRTRVVTETAS